MQIPDPRNLLSALLLCLITWAGVLCPQNTLAQDIEADENTEDVVRRVRFSGNEDIKDRTLTTLVRTRTNREFLSIPQFTPWYLIWNISGGRFGEEPAYLRSSNRCQRY
ncbi:MAG: hypothetical protein U5K71_07960 [Gracilimonas sp.]|nr:hypothetical protein [Gracilimonas sp.]